MIRILFYSVGTVVMLGGAVLYPGYRYLYLLCVVLGLSGTWKAYSRWAESRSRN